MSTYTLFTIHLVTLLRTVEFPLLRGTQAKKIPTSVGMEIDGLREK